MTHKQRIVEWFKARNGFATLGEILKSGEPWGYEWRARASEMRRAGFTITCDRGPRPSENLYRLHGPETTDHFRT